MTLLFFLTPPALASYKWIEFCATAVIALSPGDPNYFPGGVNARTVAEKLKPLKSEDVVFRGEPVKVQLPDGKEYEFRFGRAPRSLNDVLLLTEGKKAVCELSFRYDAVAKRLEIENTETKPDFARKGASKLLLKTALEVSGPVKEATATPAWINFKKLAEKLEPGKDMKDMLAAEQAVAAGISKIGWFRSGPIVEAIEGTPTGAAMKELGFKVDVGSLKLHAGKEIPDYGPMLDVKWTRR